MPPPSPSIDPEQVLAHDPFVRSLARSLLRDAGAAEDVAQEAMAAACREQRPIGSVRGWLAAVVRRLAGRRVRADRRERARQQAVAAAAVPAVPSAAAIVQREAVRAEVVRAVLALPEHYRAVVLLRFFENLPPRAIARRLAVPVETVRTRLKRALAELRRELDAHAGGDRGAWCLLLLPFARGGSGAAAAAAAVVPLLHGVLLMSIPVRAAIAAVLCIGVAAAWWTFGGEPGATPAAVAPAPRVAAAEHAALPVTAASAAAETAVAEEPGVEREAAPDAAGAATGSLRVQVAWSDGTPAAGVVVDLRRRFLDDLLEQQRATAGEDGEATFAAVVPGRTSVHVTRGDYLAHARVEIVAGEQATTKLTLQRGIDATGIVVDARDRPVADAEVLVAGWAGSEARVLARTAADGTFALRSIGTHCHVGARAKGLTTSSLRTITAGEGAGVELRIVLGERAGSVRGTVLGPDGAPVRGALVRVGSNEQDNHKLPDGATAMAPRPVDVCTDERGTFAVEAPRLGAQPLAVRASGLAPWEGAVEVAAGASVETIVRLVAGVTLEGIVRDEKGAPIAKATVTAGEWGRIGRRETTTDAAGAYRIEGLAARELPVSVEGSHGLGKVETKVEGRPGAVVRWDPVLTAGLQLRGRVVDDQGEPVASVIVEARSETGAPGPHWSGIAGAGKDGAFMIPNCPADVALRIDVRRHRMVEARVRNVRPGSEPILIRLPKPQFVRIRGTVLDPDGKPLPNVSLQVRSETAGGDMDTVDPATGSFDVGPYVPGLLTLKLSAAGLAPILQQRLVAPDEVWDLGTLRFVPGGTLVVAVVGTGPAPPKVERITVWTSEGVWLDNLAVERGLARGGPFAEGTYTLQIQGEHTGAVRKTAAVRAGVETRIDLPVADGVAIELTLPLPAGAPPDAVPFEVFDAQGTLLLATRAWPQDGPPRHRFALAPGRYVARATGGEWRGEHTFDVAAPGPVAVELAVVAR